MNEIKIPALECKRCNHNWKPDSPFLPKVCPKCNSSKWDKERGLFNKLREKKEKEEYERAGDLSELDYDLRKREKDEE
ncbi:MAG: hypothetical protein DRN27_03130 [Thermoplasmata archaeon]|nr:MAG: hypothetical protein DRN27_03130 [Thermoplasmata archaeon]